MVEWWQRNNYIILWIIWNPTFFSEHRIKVWLHLVFVSGGFQLIPIKTNRHDYHNNLSVGIIEKQENKKFITEKKFKTGNLNKIQRF